MDPFSGGRRDVNNLDGELIFVLLSGFVPLLVFSGCQRGHECLHDLGVVKGR